MFELTAKNIESIKDIEEFQSFLEAIKLDFECNREQWNNTTIDAYFEAISAWISSQGENIRDEKINWGTIAKLMYIGKIYE